LADHIETRVRICDDQAVIRNGNSSFRVARGDDTGSRVDCPMQMLVGALGACIVLTVDAVAKNKGIVLTDFETRLNYSTDGNGHTKFEVALHLGSDLSDRERKILYQSAKLCEVGKLLKSDIEIDYRVCEPAPAT
jgi:uncharacterized OsmC-like protein